MRVHVGHCYGLRDLSTIRRDWTYDGPLTMADDLTVLNVTKDHIEVREVTFNEDSWPQGTSKEWDTAPRGAPAIGLMQEWLREGALEGLNPPPTQPID